MTNKIPIESELVELKRELPPGNKLAKEVIAFANTKGGRIIIGYDDKNHETIGVTPSQPLEERVINIISDYITPQPVFYVGYETVNEKTILTIDIEAGSSTPYFLKNKGLDSAYVRVGSTSRKADRETLARLIRQGKNIPFDNEQISGTSLELLEEKLITSFLSDRNRRFEAHKPKISKALIEDLGACKGEILTIAGVLLFHRNPQEIIPLQSAYIKAARFRGLEKGEFIDQQNIGGPLPQQIEEATRFTLRNTKVVGTISGIKREDRQEYPVNVIREAITNAVVHRDYSFSGAVTFLAIFDDRIEITSPGGLPAYITPDNILERQYSRNPTIAKRLFEMGYFDSWGQGIDMIVKWATNQAVPMPDFIDNQDTYTLVIYSPFSKHSKKERNREELIVLAYLDAHQQIANREIQQICNFSKTQAQSLLKSMIEKGVIRRQGKGRNVVYTKI